VLLGDAGICACAQMGVLKARGLDRVLRSHQMRSNDMRGGTWLGWATTSVRKTGQTPHRVRTTAHGKSVHETSCQASSLRAFFVFKSKAKTSALPACGAPPR